MKTRIRHSLALALVTAGAIPVTASATNGYFSHGWGVRSKAMAGVDSLLFHPDRLYSRHDFEARQQALYAKRREILLSYPGLDPEVAASIKK